MRDRSLPASLVRPRTLANWARRSANMDHPVLDIPELLNHFGLAVVERRELKRASRLSLRNDQLTVEVRQTIGRTFKFNCAHELGHYLLAKVGRVTFTEQTSNPLYEAYCNQFASELLIPRVWLSTTFKDTCLSLEDAAALSRILDVTLLTTGVALNDTCDWGHIMVRWKSASPTKLLAANVISPRRCGIVQSAARTDRFLREVGTSATQITLPITIGGRDREVAAQAMVFDNSFFSAFPMSAI